MAFPLAEIGLGLQAGSSIISGFLGSKQKKDEAAIAGYNAEVKRQEAEQIRRQTKFLQSRQAEQAARVQGELEASIGGSGIVSTEGAPLMALALQKSESDLESYLIGLQGRTAANQALSIAGEYEMMQRKAKADARSSVIAGFLGAGASLISGLSSLPNTTTPTKTATAAKTSQAYKSYRPSSGYGTF